MSGRKDYSFGIILILIGIVMLLSKAGFATSELFMIAIGIAFLSGYYFKRNNGYLIAGMVILVIGITSAVDEYINLSVDISGFVFMIGIGIVFLILYFSKHIHGFIYPGCILPAIGTFSLLDDIYHYDIGWAFFLFMGIAFYLIYLIDTRKKGYKWPITVGTILVIISGLFYITSQEMISYDLWKALSYIWPGILIVIGLKIIYNNAVSK